MNRTSLLFLLMLSAILPLKGQISSTFELRYFSKEKSASGINDFKGEYEFLDTEQRIEFLNVYADIASRWFMDSTLQKRVNEQEDIDRFLKTLKPQALPEERERILLEAWKKTGWTKQSPGSEYANPNWYVSEGSSTDKSVLSFNASNVRIHRSLDSLEWRFHMSWKARSNDGKTPLIIGLKSRNRLIIETGFHSNGNIFYTEKEQDRMGGAYLPGKWYNFKLEVDLVSDRYNLLIDGEKIGDWISLSSTQLIDELMIIGNKGMEIDDISGLEFDTTGCTMWSPYHILPFINEDFNPEHDLSTWMNPEHDDSLWETDELPIVHGGALEAGEDLLLRKQIRIAGYKKAILHIETLDPGGEIWINGRVVFVAHNKYPIKLDISDFLLPYKENLIAIRVFPFYNDGPLHHSPQDRNIGWFCGRAWIDLMEETHFESVKVYTESIGENALQYHKIGIRNSADSTFSGTVELDYYPWHPKESVTSVAHFSIPVKIFAGDSIQLRYRAEIEHPLLWTHADPNLYRIRLQLKRKGKIIDDEVLTSGIRTVSQEEGIFRINKQPELLGGAQTMGFRMPVENLAKWNRCAPASVLVDELLACKKLGNTLRIHVHAGSGQYAYSVNDPRVAEMADQLGLMLVWPTSAWIREGEWGGIDFEGYPKYMEQVFNHPSIVLWEGSNHPNRFGGKSLDYSNRFISKMYNTIANIDSSRLIAPSSYNRHFIYNNDEGTIDKDGNPIVAAKEWTAPLIVRANQDALTGYGASWDAIRKWPDPYRLSFLQSKERAYFNLEHEESIGMQNFDLAKGQPWYRMPSYENIYDERSIGRQFEYEEWRTSQAWQAFSAWESMKWQRINDIDGFSWCCLHGGPNSGTYRKPIIDAFGHAKLGYYINQMALQDIIPGSNNTDIVYGKKDQLTPVILNLGPEREVRFKILIKARDGSLIDSKVYENVTLQAGRTLNELPSFKPKFKDDGYYAIEYYVLSK